MSEQALFKFAFLLANLLNAFVGRHGQQSGTLARRQGAQPQVVSTQDLHQLIGAGMAFELAVQVAQPLLLGGCQTLKPCFLLL